MLLAPGVAFKQIYSCNVDDLGENVVLWLEMNDGSIRSIYWPLVERAGEIHASERSPAGAILQ